MQNHKRPFSFFSSVLTLALLAAAASPANADITAGEVVDEQSLKLFVERAAAFANSRVEHTDDAYDFFARSFRPTGEWRMGSIYLFVMGTDGINLFHPTRTDVEGTDRNGRVDKTGKRYIREMISKAKEGGGFVEYHFDNPAVEGDEVEGSRKVTYAKLLDIPGRELLIAAGIYPDTAVPIAPPLALLALAAMLLGGAYRRLRLR